MLLENVPFTEEDKWAYSSLWDNISHMDSLKMFKLHEYYSYTQTSG